MSIKWRCICVFFLAAAMEISIVMRENERFRRVKAESSRAGRSDKYDSEQTKQSGDKIPTAVPVPADNNWSMFSFMKRIEMLHNSTAGRQDDIHKSTSDLHKKHDELRKSINDLHDTLKTKSSNTNGGNAQGTMQVVHVNYPPPMLPVQTNQMNHTNQVNQNIQLSPGDIERITRMMLEILKSSKGGVVNYGRYNPSGTLDDFQSRVNAYT